MTLELEKYFSVLDLTEAVISMQKTGGALVPKLLHEPFRIQVLQEVLLLPFKPAKENYQTAHQLFEYCDPANQVNLPHLELLRQASQELIQQQGEILHNPGLKQWAANDTAIQRYHTGGGITSHKDPGRYTDLIAIWNMAGSCIFDILEDRHGLATKHLHPQPGDLILLRGATASPSLLTPDSRPFHRLRNIFERADRISITFRYNNL